MFGHASALGNLTRVKPRTRESLTRLIAREPLSDERIVRAFEAVDRRLFVPEEYADEAYEDHPVVIPEAQTTSQPSLIARMIDSVAPTAHDRVLEVGTGYGFQTALLARLCREVVSIDRHPTLVERARRNLRRAGMTNVELHVGDGFEGVQERAPYDAIVVSAAASEVPPALVSQMTDGGRMVIPLAGAIGDDVYLFRKTGNELERVRLVTPARFVPLVRDGT